MAIGTSTSNTRRRRVFDGEICGFGTSSGHRVIIGRWWRSPLGAFTDVMHEASDGERVLRAPSDEVARFVQTTYSFDRVEIVPVSARRSPVRLEIDAGDLVAAVDIGRRSAIGRILHAVPTSLARSPVWCTAIDPVARIAMRGVRTRGTAGNDRREWYGATDAHAIDSVRCRLDDVDLGDLADVWPPVRFGFSSTPRHPSIVAVTTTIEDLGSR